MNITDDLLLDISQPLQSFDRLDDALNESARAAGRLNTEMHQTGREAEIAAREAGEMETVLRDVERIAGRAATETGSIALAAGRAEVNFRDMAQALNLSEDDARRLTTEILQSQAAANRLEDATRDVARQLDLSEDEARRFTSALNRASGEASELDRRTAALPGRLVSMRTVAQGVAGAFAAIGATQLFSLAGRGIGAAITEFQALNESINAVNVTFETGAAQVLKFGESSAQSAGLSRQAFQQAVVPIGAVLTNFGFNAGEAGDAAVLLVQRAADLASVFNTDVSQALGAINSALVGQVEPLRRYGAEISVARAEQFAFATGLARTREELTDSVLTQARLGLILQDTRKVQGDFVNTSTQLANAMRTGKAEVQEFGSEMGEVLAPAVAAVVNLMPDLLDGLRQVIPSFAAAADSAAAFFSAVDKGSGVRTPFQSVATGVGLAVDALNGLGDVFSGVFDTLQIEFGRVGTQIDQFNTRVARTTQRIGGNFLARELDSGADAALSFANALSFVAREQENIEVFSQSFRGFAIQAGLSAVELRDVTQFMLDNAVAAGLSAGEIHELELQLGVLNNTLHVVGNEINTAQRAMEELNRPDATSGTRFVTFAENVEEAKSRASVALTELAVLAETQAQRTADAFNLFEEIPEQIGTSFADAVETLRAQVEAAVDFDLNLAILRALNLDALADDFAREGVKSADRLSEAINNIPLAIEADRLLQGFSDIGQAGFEAMVQRLVGAGLSTVDAQRLAQHLKSPEVLAAIEAAAVDVGATGAAKYHETLIDEMDQLIPDVGNQIARDVSTHWNIGDEADEAARASAQAYVDGLVGFNIADRLEAIFDQVNLFIDLSDEGRASGDSYMGGMQERIAAREDGLKRTIVNTLDSAIERQSPPRLFARAGADSADAFWDNFFKEGAGLMRPLPAIGNLGGGGGGAGPNVSNVNVQNTINHPVTDSLLSDVMMLDQLTGAAAAELRSFNS